MRVAPLVRAFVFVVLFTKPLVVTAQNKDAVQQGRADAPRVDPDNKKALQVADYARWRSIATPAISSDGKWVAWSYTQVRRDEELHIKQADGDREIVVNGGTRPTFSDDAQWVAVDLKPVKPLSAPVQLAAIRYDKRLSQLPLIRQSQLSVMPLTKDEFDVIVAMGSGKTRKR